MKNYVKPSLEVISMKTSENIADNIIKTIYTKAKGDAGYTTVSTGAWDASTDLNESSPL